MAIFFFLGLAFSWVSASIGMLVKSTETAQVAGFIWVFPLVFASSIFFPVASMLMTLFLRDARESALASAALAVGALFVLGLSADFGVSAAATGLVFSFATIAVITIFYILATAFGPTRRNNA